MEKENKQKNKKEKKKNIKDWISAF